MSSDGLSLRPPPSTDILGGAQEGTVVFDDDGGKAEIVPLQPLVPREPIDHGGPVVESGRLRLLFLGTGWRGPAAADRELFTRELSRRHTVDAHVLADADDPDDALRDLEVQRRLDARLGTEPVPPADDGTVFVVLAAPGLEVRLGESSSARDFAAYHNWFHRAGGVVRYVVVPYQEDAARLVAAACRSVEQTLRNPEGNGWY